MNKKAKHKNLTVCPQKEALDVSVGAKVSYWVNLLLHHTYSDYFAILLNYLLNFYRKYHMLLAPSRVRGRLL